jgi:haloacetate dehalogenase
VPRRQSDRRHPPLRGAFEALASGLRFEGFSDATIDVGDGISIRTRASGAGRPVLLLHGYPETHACWHAVAPRLVAAGFRVVATDLRGYWDSAKPAATADHATYAKRAMAADQVAVMRALGHPRFAVAGHDRGGRVAHRMALDHPDAVSRLAVLDIAPTATMYGRTAMDFARAYYHWFFLIQPAPFPERLIGADPEFYLRTKLSAWSQGGNDFFAPEAIAEYVRCFADPAAIAASCEDYRAAASIDLGHDAADADRRIEAQLLALWGARGVVGRTYDVLATWRDKARDVRGHALPTGHYLPEEAPEQTAAALADFFAAS